MNRFARNTAITVALAATLLAAKPVFSGNYFARQTPLTGKDRIEHVEKAPKPKLAVGQGMAASGHKHPIPAEFQRPTVEAGFGISPENVGVKVFSGHFFRNFQKGAAHFAVETKEWFKRCISNMEKGPKHAAQSAIVLLTLGAMALHIPLLVRAARHVVDKSLSATVAVLGGISTLPASIITVFFGAVVPGIAAYKLITEGGLSEKTVQNLSVVYGFFAAMGCFIAYGFIDRAIRLKRDEAIRKRTGEKGRIFQCDADVYVDGVKQDRPITDEQKLKLSRQREKEAVKNPRKGYWAFVHDWGNHDNYWLAAAGRMAGECFWEGLRYIASPNGHPASGGPTPMTGSQQEGLQNLNTMVDRGMRHDNPMLPPNQR